VLGHRCHEVATHWPASGRLQAALHLHLARDARIGAGAPSPRVANVASRRVGMWLLACLTMTEIRTAGDSRCRRCTLGLVARGHAHRPSPGLFTRHRGHGTLALESARRFGSMLELPRRSSPSDQKETDDLYREKVPLQAGAALSLIVVLCTGGE